jgi:DNA repair exonuclease SbcCD ATPase subunit
MSSDESTASDAPLGLDRLEEKVQAAAIRLRELAAENERLTARSAELEAAGDSGAAEPAEAPGAAEWRRERDEVRRRVEKLARRLADLLGESS